MWLPVPLRSGGQFGDKFLPLRLTHIAIEAKAFGGCHSFAPNTKVWMANGTAKAIKDVKLGDKVAATDPAPTISRWFQAASVARCGDTNCGHLDGLGRVSVRGTAHPPDGRRAWPGAGAAATPTAGTLPAGRTD